MKKETKSQKLTKQILGLKVKLVEEIEKEKAKIKEEKEKIINNKK